MANSRGIYLSAYIAFGSYFLILILFYAYLSSNKVKKFDSFTKDTVLELDIMIENTKDVKLNYLKVQSTRKDSKLSKNIVKKSSSVSSKQRSDLKSLFANVKTKSKVIKKKIVSTIKKSSITSRFKSKFEKQSKSNNSMLSKLLDSKKLKLTKKKSGDAKNENDKYISNIYELLYSRWKPITFVDGLSAKVIITIYGSGIFNYKIIQYSGDNSFDDQIVSFLDNQKLKLFPKPNKLKIDIEVIFTAKG